MGWRVKRINQELKAHDRRLYAQETRDGIIQVWRQADRFDSADLSNDETGHSRPTQFILALTDNWQASGNAIDYGIEPLIHRIRNMDGWMRGSQLADMRKRREREKEDKDRQWRNDNRARAADLRSEFAKATNDINTSSLDMSDARRKYGNC